MKEEDWLSSRVGPESSETGEWLRVDTVNPSARRPVRREVFGPVDVRIGWAGGRWGKFTFEPPDDSREPTYRGENGLSLDRLILHELYSYSFEIELDAGSNEPAGDLTLLSIRIDTKGCDEAEILEKRPGLYGAPWDGFLYGQTKSGGLVEWASHSGDFSKGLLAKVTSGGKQASPIDVDVYLSRLEWSGRGTIHPSRHQFRFEDRECEYTDVERGLLKVNDHQCFEDFCNSGRAVTMSFEMFRPESPATEVDDADGDDDPRQRSTIREGDHSAKGHSVVEEVSEEGGQ